MAKKVNSHKGNWAILQEQKTTPVRTEVAIGYFTRANLFLPRLIRAISLIWTSSVTFAPFIAGGEAGLDEDVEELSTFGGGREALS